MMTGLSEDYRLALKVRSKLNDDLAKENLHKVSVQTNMLNKLVVEIRRKNIQRLEWKRRYERMVEWEGGVMKGVKNVLFKEEMEVLKGERMMLRREFRREVSMRSYRESGSDSDSDSDSDSYSDSSSDSSDSSGYYSDSDSSDEYEEMCDEVSRLSTIEEVWEGGPWSECE